MKSFSDSSLRSILRRLSFSYPGNLGFVEMMAFQDLASEDEKDLMDFYLQEEDYPSAWELLQKVTETHLEDL